MHLDCNLKRDLCVRFLLTMHHCYKTTTPCKPQLAIALVLSGQLGLLVLLGLIVVLLLELSWLGREVLVDGLLDGLLGFSVDFLKGVGRDVVVEIWRTGVCTFLRRLLRGCPLPKRTIPNLSELHVEHRSLKPIAGFLRKTFSCSNHEYAIDFL